MHVISTPVLLDFSKIFPLNDDSFYFRTLHLSACHLQVLWILLHHRKYSEPSCFYIMLIALAPSDIRFMQDSIHHSFYGGGRVNDVIDQICYRHTSLNNIPTIEVTNRNGKYYSLDNRRLYLYRVLEKRGFLFRITVFLVSRWDERKFTTLNDGASIFVRGDTTFPHAIEETKKPLENLAETLRTAVIFAHNAQNNVGRSEVAVDGLIQPATSATTRRNTSFPSSSTSEDEESLPQTEKIVKDVENQKPSFGLTPQCQDNMPIDLVPAENKIHSNTEENKTTDQKERSIQIFESEQPDVCLPSPIPGTELSVDSVHYNNKHPTEAINIEQNVFDNVGQTNSTLEVQTSQPTECSSGTFAHNFMSSASSVCEDGSDIFQRSDKSFCQWLFSCCFSKTSTL